MVPGASIEGMQESGQGVTVDQKRMGLVAVVAELIGLLEQFVGQDAGVLRVVLELYDVVVIVGTAHQMRLRSAPHAANVLHSSGHGWLCYRRLAKAASEECLPGAAWIKGKSKAEHAPV